jgi:hypothetical protein
MRISMRACVVFLTVILIAGFLSGCSSSANTQTVKPPVATKKPVVTKKPNGDFSVISHATTTNEFGVNREVWCIYVKAFKDDTAVWNKIRSYGQNLAGQAGAGNVQTPAAIYFFDRLSGVGSPAEVDNFWNVPGEDPHCVASFSEDISGQVIAWEYPFVDSKATPLSPMPQ